jgi:hypothetical protein
MTDEELMKATGKISHEEAKQILSRLCKSHFKQAKGALISIPADPIRDDDLRMSSYILQCERMRTILESELRMSSPELAAWVLAGMFGDDQTEETE